MEITQQNSCVKYILPDGRFLDVLTDVFDEMYKWLQNEANSPESGGYIVGYQHDITKNVSLEKISHPFSGDYCNRIHFTIKDPRHNSFLRKEEVKKSYYMGVWHTHPQDVPIPSSIDWEDWRSSIENETSGCGYIIFIIAGRKQVRIWAGDMFTKVITELQECQKVDGIYVKGVTTDEAIAKNNRG